MYISYIYNLAKEHMCFVCYLGYGGDVEALDLAKLRAYIGGGHHVDQSFYLHRLPDAAHVVRDHILAREHILVREQEYLMQPIS